VRHIAVLDAPSNLGLRPPTETSVPGCAKAPGALRDHGLLTRLGARDAGCLTPPRYDAGDWRPGDGVAHAAQIANYSRRLADRIGAILDAGEFPVILGGDCSILLGSGIAMHRLGEAIGGRIGLVFVDGHSDFRHPGNASYVGAAAGEDLALVTGRGQADLASIEGRRPYFRDIDVVVLGIRAQDEHRLDLQAAGIITRPVPALRAEGAARSAQWARDQLADCAGYWVHVDVDVLDPAVMPAVDAPSPGGIAFPELELLLAGLVESPHCLGVELTVFDPDYDPDGDYAAEITSTVTAGLAPAKTVALRPDLAAARRDLDRSPQQNAAAARERRRAEAAAESVSLAAAGASGVSGTPEEAPVPATTLLAVEDGADLPAERPLPPGPLLPAAGPLEGASAAAGRLKGASAADPADTMPDGRTAEADPVEAAPNGDRSGVEPAGLSGLAPVGGVSGVEPAGLSGLAPVDDVSGVEPAGLSGLAPVDDVSRVEPTADFSGVSPAGDPSGGAHAAGPSEAVLAGDARAALVGGPSGAAHAGDSSEATPAGDSLEAAPTDEPSSPPVGEEREAELSEESAETATADSAGPGDLATDLAASGEPADLSGEDATGGATGASDQDEPSAAVTDDPEQAESAPDTASRTSRRRSRLAPRNGSADSAEAPVRVRPLGSAPLLDSEPLPATRPGMLRPRRAEASDGESVTPHTSEGFSLPVQRPAFDAGSGEPADIA
jgi:arginase